MKTHRTNILLAALLLAIAGVPAAQAHSIDYVAANISPAAGMVGGSGNWSVVDPVDGGSTISFDLSFHVEVQGQTTSFPRTIGFGATTQAKPDGASDVAVSAIPSCIFNSAASSCQTPVTLTAPSTPGGYSVKIQAASGTGGQGGLGGGNGIVISFVVADNPPAPIATSLSLSIGSGGCIVLHETSVTFTATLSAEGSGLAGEEIDFTVDGLFVGSAITDLDGVASLLYDPSGLGVGDHTVGAEFVATATHLGSIKTETLGVSYLFVGFQQPINADGSSRFNGRVVPVKAKIVDAFGVPIGDATAHVYFAFGSVAVVGTDAEPVANTSGDLGNTMRWDPVAQQYVFNWDVKDLPNGTYTVRLDFGEGSCGDSHTVVLSLQRKGK